MSMVEWADCAPGKAPPDFIEGQRHRKELQKLDREIELAKKRQELLNVGRDEAAVIAMHMLGYRWVAGNWIKGPPQEN